ncbi:MAG: sensor histidine kinase [Owenweeksia sp.]
MAKRLNPHLGEFLLVVGIALFPPLLSIIRYYVGSPGGPDDMSLAYCSVSFTYSFLVTGSLYYGCSFIFHWFSRKMPWNEAGLKRLLPEIVVIFTYTTITQFLIITAFGQTSLFEGQPLTPSFYFENIFFGNTVTLIVMAIVEGVYLFRAWKKTLLNAEKLKTESLKSQFDSLKGQLDPHFLFNSLNVLSSLVEKDPEKAQHFIDDFARVYRYVLEVKDEMVVPLHRELQVLESYLNLQKIRFAEGIKVKKEIAAGHLDMYVPPLSLQELVSNAIKHNEASLGKPLNIEIRSEGNYVVVCNNLQLRSEKVPSTGTGLGNLQARYSLLSSKKAHFRILDDHYRAEIPLIESEQ